MRIMRVSPCVSYEMGVCRTPRNWPTRIDNRCVVPRTRPVKMRVKAFTPCAETFSSTNSAAVQFPRDMIPGRSIIDADARPGLAAVFGRRMIAERQNAGTKDRATARQRHLAFQRPFFAQRFTPELP